MIKNKNFVIFSDDWGRHPSSCQHLVKQLAADNRIIWVNTIGMRSPRLSNYDVKRSFEVLKNWFFLENKNRENSDTQNFQVVKPIIIPFNNFKIIRKLNKHQIKKSIKKVMLKNRIVDPIVLTTFPCTCDLIGAMGEILHIYYCVDDFVNWPGVDRNLIEKMEEELILGSDLVFTTSMTLSAAKQRPSKNNSLLPHGVDFDHFHSASGAIEKPEEITALNSPIVGFMGAVSEWLDFDLILMLANAKPEWNFLFIGPVDTDISCLLKYKNIRLIGKVPYEVLPKYASCFDVGIIPFQVNELTRSVNPLKLLEYLSLGIPVVSTYMPELERFSGAIDMVWDHDGFLKALEMNLLSDSIERRQERIEIARNHSWRTVASEFNASVCAAIKKKSGALYGASIN